MTESLKISLAILQRIPRTWFVSAPQIREQLLDAGYTRSLRSIERQLISLTEQFEIERDTRSKPYGYKWKSNAVGLNLPTLSSHESLLFILAERHLHNLLPPELLRTLDSHFEQAKRTVGIDASEFLLPVDQGNHKKI